MGCGVEGLNLPFNTHTVCLKSQPRYQNGNAIPHHMITIIAYISFSVLHFCEQELHLPDLGQISSSGQFVYVQRSSSEEPPPNVAGASSMASTFVSSDDNNTLHSTNHIDSNTATCHTQRETAATHLQIPISADNKRRVIASNGVPPATTRSADSTAVEASTVSTARTATAKNNADQVH